MHQGYTNYETFSVAVVMDNDRKTHDHFAALTAQTRDEIAAGEHDGRTVEGVLADRIQEWHDERIPEDLPGPFGSLLFAGYSEVDWYDIATELLQTLAENEEHAEAKS